MIRKRDFEDCIKCRKLKKKNGNNNWEEKIAGEFYKGVAWDCKQARFKIENMWECSWLFTHNWTKERFRQIEWMNGVMSWRVKEWMRERNTAQVMFFLILEHAFPDPGRLFVWSPTLLFFPSLLPYYSLLLFNTFQYFFLRMDKLFLSYILLSLLRHMRSRLYLFIQTPSTSHICTHFPSGVCFSRILSTISIASDGLAA